MATKKKTTHENVTFVELTNHLAGMIGATKESVQFDQTNEELADDCLDCLKKMLQLAIDVEFSTIPPYLCALWSIKDELHPVAKSIREVVQEEMLHMALACNLLTAIGGRPELSNRWPKYPTKLPGCLHEDLTVTLSGLSLESLRTFMWVETPMKIFPLDPRESNWPRKVPRFKNDNTIGEFYEVVEQAMRKLDPPLSQEKQVTGPLAYSNIGSQKGVKWAIELISHQGEGSTETPFENEYAKDIAHYYRFVQVYVESELVWSPVNEHFEKGKPAPLPDVWPMAQVPEGGYEEKHLKGLDDTERELVTYHLEQFDIVYSQLLDLLQAAWTTRGGQAALIEAYETMFKLQDHALPLIQIKIPDGDGMTFGPCFRYRSGS